MYHMRIACLCHISRTQSFQQNRHIIFLALVALKLLVSLISRLVACSARIVVDRQTHRTTTVTLAAHARRGLIITLCVSLSQRAIEKFKMKLAQIPVREQK